MRAAAAGLRALPHPRAQAGRRGVGGRGDRGRISIGLPGGIGRLIITYAQQATGDPARVYAPIIGAAFMGLFAVGMISLLDVGLRRYQTQEEAI